MNESDYRTALSLAYLEPDFGDAPLGAEETPRFDSPVNISFHSIRKRLTDSDGASGKAVIDGLVKAGLLADDSPEYVKKVSFSQQKTKFDEVTLLTIQITGNN